MNVFFAFVFSLGEMRHPCHACLSRCPHNRRFFRTVDIVEGRRKTNVTGVTHVDEYKREESAKKVIFQIEILPSATQHVDILCWICALPC